VTRNPQWQGRTHGGTLGQKGLFTFFRVFSLSLGYLFLHVFVVFYMIFSRKGFNSIWYYYRKIWGFGVLKSLRRAYRNHYLFGQNLLDKFSLFAGKKNPFKISVTGREIFEEIINSPKGAIIVSSHVGNFEILGYLLHQNQKRINAIIFGGENPVIQQYRQDILSENNVFQIPAQPDMSHIFTINEVLKRGEIVSMPSDRVFTGNKTINLNFMGKPAYFPTGAYHLAVKFDVPVLTLYVMRESGKHYHVIIRRIDNYADGNLSSAEKIELLAKGYVANLELILEKYPDQWYNYFKFWN
jgi:predicted LPLAT superfamily acyltransferase